MIKKISYHLILVLIFFSFSVTFAYAGGDLFIKNGTILTITNGVIENGSLLIRDGKIVAVGKYLEPPEGVKVIDATGHYVMPGIIDFHSHMGIDRGINEATSQVVPQVDIEDVILHDDLSFYRALAGGCVMIQNLHGSANVIGGENAVIKLKFGKSAAELFVPGAIEGVKFALGENPKRRGANSNKFPSSRTGISYIMRKAFTQAQEYIKEWEDYEKAKRGEIPPPNGWAGKVWPIPPKKDLKMEVLADLIKGKKGVVCHSYVAREIEDLYKVCDEFGVKVYSLEHCLTGYKVADIIKEHGSTASIFMDNWAYKVEAFECIPYNAALMTKRGVNVAINSDSGERVRRLFQDAAKALKYGNLTETEALSMITINSAKGLHLEDRCGSIEVGKDGDIAIFDGHPLSVYSKVVKTIIEGEIYFNYDNAMTAEKVLAKFKAENK